MSDSTPPDVKDPRFWWKFLDRFGIATVVSLGLAASFWYWSWSTEKSHERNNERDNETMRQAWNRIGALTERLHKVEQALLLVHPKEGKKARLLDDD